MRFWLYALAVLLLAACHSGERQRLQLEELERQNRADSLMLNDSLARALADWFDRHGTPNEQMRAYYILGRTYADRGETPAALEAYNDAIDHADTIAADCNYYTLCRVYSQMAVLFFGRIFSTKICVVLTNPSTMPIWLVIQLQQSIRMLRKQMLMNY